jgi:hypothetical protein
MRVLRSAQASAVGRSPGSLQESRFCTATIGATASASSRWATVTLDNPMAATALAVLPQTARNDPCCNSEYLTDCCEQYHGDISLGRCLLSRCLGRPGVPLQENDPSG